MSIRWLEVLEKAMSTMVTERSRSAGYAYASVLCVKTWFCQNNTILDSKLLSASRFVNASGFCLESERIPRRLKQLIQLCVWDAIAFAIYLDVASVTNIVIFWSGWGTL
ncbi:MULTISPECIES: hypothetical protein [unclassified Nostoc]|nr:MULTISPECIES: hypothetical protein [unclassified Nostoc]MDM9585554.1 hypothetical protein [Nostoc sp. GT001]